MKMRKVRAARKNFFPTLIVIILLWTGLFFIIYFVDPAILGVIPLFFIALFLSLIFTFSTLFANKRRGLIISLAISLFLILRYFGVGNILNLILISAVAIAAEIYFGQS